MRSAKVEVEVEVHDERPTLALDAIFEAGAGKGCLGSELTAVDPADGDTLGAVSLRSVEGAMDAVPARFRLGQTQKAVRLAVGSPRNPDGIIEVGLVGRTLR